MRERDLPALAPAAGFEFEHEGPARSVPEWASVMAAEWRAALARFPRAVVGAMAGLGVDRAARLVDGGGVPTPSEARAIDGALQTDASRLLPARRPLVQRPFDGARPDRAPVRKTHAPTGPRQARVDAWAARVEASGLSTAAVAAKAELGPGRVLRILKQGAIPQPFELEALAAVLGLPEPPTAKSDGGCLQSAPGVRDAFERVP